MKDGLKVEVEVSRGCSGIERSGRRSERGVLELRIALERGDGLADMPLDVGGEGGLCTTNETKVNNVTPLVLCDRRVGCACCFGSLC